MLTAHQPAQGIVSALVEVPQISAETLARCHEAGRALGAKRTDYWGQPTRAVEAPEGSATVRRCREWESKRAS
jgi:hypothetical protein